MHHTFLYEPGRWTMSGMFWSADGAGMAVEGSTEISHGQHCWMLVGSSILSLYRSEQGGYLGTEHLHQMTPDQYVADGVILMDDRRLSSWRVTLTR